MPTLVTVAHGTRHAPGNKVARALTQRCARGLDVPGVASYVELCAPSFASVIAAATGPTVVVPLLLSTGHHVRHDLPAALAGARHPVSLAPPLGPDPVLAVAQATRLVEAGARPGQPVVLVAAGSTDPAADADLEEARRLLGEMWAGPVEVATLSGRGRRPADVVRPGVAVSPYLLSPGFFARRARAEGLAAGADTVAEVIGVQECVADLVAERFLGRVRRVAA
ncbi:sirohydrochlorin chelatase [Nocardioides sp. MAHUQ-72]|uniref:sirohydrochlorin chelatase n=1 Tax=unclassified Nocardioides TaxID=2615069 RepID=UPI0036118568